MSEYVAKLLGRKENDYEGPCLHLYRLNTVFVLFLPRFIIVYVQGDPSKCSIFTYMDLKHERHLAKWGLRNRPLSSSLLVTNPCFLILIRMNSSYFVEFSITYFLAINLYNEKWDSLDSSKSVVLL